MVGRYCDGAAPTVDVDPVLGADFEGLVEEVSGLLDGAEITQALERIWVRVRRLNRYVEETQPWQLAKDPAKADELATTLRSLAEGLRVVTVLLNPYIPESTEKLLDRAWARRTSSLAGAVYGSHPGGQPVQKLAPLFPEAGMIDSHTHLHADPAVAAEWVADARAVGVTRILTIGTDEESCAAALARLRGPRGRLLRRRPAPELHDRLRGDRLAALDRLAPERARDRRDRAGRLPRLRAARRPGAGVRRPDRAGARGRQAAGHPHPRRRGRHDRHAGARGGRPRGHPALLLDARPARGVPRPRLVDLLRGQRHLPEGERPGGRGGTRAAWTGCWSRPTRRT